MSLGRTTRLLPTAVSLLALAAAPAAAWGPATHAYVANHAGKIWPSLDRTEIYGAMLPDACYFAYGWELQGVCADVTHEGYIAMWEGAGTLDTRALGFGYASHNWEWGADFTAHSHGVLFGKKDGYVVWKARKLAWLLGSNPYLGSLPFAQREAIAHTMVEVGTDVLVKRIDPLMGTRLTLAALLRGSFVPQRYASVYAAELAQQTGMDPAVAAAALAEVEANFRNAMLVYGAALMKDEDATLDTLAAQFAPLAVYWGVSLPDDVLVPLIRQLIEGAMALCAPDFPYELRATTAKVRWNLWWNGVWY